MTAAWGSPPKDQYTVRNEKISREISWKRNLVVELIYTLMILAVLVDQESGKHHFRNSDFQENYSQ